MRRTSSHGVVGLGRAHAGGRLVETQQCRLGGERDADLEIALLAVRQVGGEFIRLAEQADGGKRLFRLLVDVGKGAVVRNHVPGMPARLGGDAHVFKHGGIRQDVGDLVGARDALLRDHVGRQAGDVVAVEQDAPGGRPQHAGQAIEEGALARPVRPDNGADLVALHLEIDLGKRGQPAETDGEQFGLEDEEPTRLPGCSPGSAASVTGCALTYDEANLQAGGTTVFSPATVSMR